MKNIWNLKKIMFIFCLLSFFSVSLFLGCNKNSGSSSSSGSGSVSYKGALVGSTGYLTAFFKGTSSYINVYYVDSSKTPVKLIKDSLTSTGISNWFPGQGLTLTNVLFSGSSGITVKLISLDADGGNPLVSLTVPGDPYVKAVILKETSQSPLQVYQGVAKASGTGSCCKSKTMNFILDPSMIGNTNNNYSVFGVYSDSVTHIAGVITAQIASSDPTVIYSIINNNDSTGFTSGFKSSNPNTNNGSGPVSGTLKISADGSTITGSILNMTTLAGGCSCSYNISATRVK